MEARHKRMLALVAMFVFLNATAALFLFFDNLVMAGTALILFSVSLYFHEINR